MADDDLNYDIALTMKVRTVNLLFSAKRTVKVGDDYRGFEASESWTFKHDQDVISPEAARKVALIHGPTIIKNVVMALHVGGVLPMAEAKATVERIKRTYGLLAGGPGETGGDQSDLRDAGRTGDQAVAGVGVGDGIPDGQVVGMQAETEHGD